MIEFEVIEARAKKQGLDKIIRVVLETEDVRALDFQKYITNETVKLEIVK